MTTSISNFLFRNSMLWIILSTTLISTSCHNRKHTAASNSVDTLQSGNCKIDRRLPHPLINDMWKNEFHFNWFSAKMDCEASDDSSKYNFDVTVRIRKDSVIWLMITDPVVGVPVARVFITRDSVKFVQKLPSEKCFVGDFAFISNLLHTEIDYEMMQSLLVGNSVSFYQEDEKLNSSVNRAECNYTLSTIRKRKLKKVLNDPQVAPSEPLQTISLDPVSFKILKILFIDAQNRTFTANYDDFTPEDSMMFPHKAIFFARGSQKSARLDVTFKRIKLNQPLEFPFNMPDDCQPILIDNGPQQPQQEQAPKGQH
ncbi:MAG TPA: DUF4292 domain-containing protein [Bacteroidia bacterium]|nr:DUF4292 domain-containing protein [Bacteroidia bacterium]